MRIIGLDYGSKTVGVAVSDPFGWNAQGVETIVREKENHLRSTVRRIQELIREYGADRIVLGLPLNMDDTVGDRGVQTMKFKKILEEKTSLPVFLWDERLTTVAAEEILEEEGIPRADWKKHVDRVAAALILEDYLHATEAGTAGTEG